MVEDLSCWSKISNFSGSEFLEFIIFVNKIPPSRPTENTRLLHLRVTPFLQSTDPNLEFGLNIRCPSTSTPSPKNPPTPPSNPTSTSSPRSPPSNAEPGSHHPSTDTSTSAHHLLILPSKTPTSPAIKTAYSTIRHATSSVSCTARNPRWESRGKLSRS